MTTRSYLSKEAAIAMLRRFFSNTTADTITVSEALAAAGRGGIDPQKNRGWLSYNLTALKEYKFLNRHYAKEEGQEKLVSLSLTAEGRKALGRDSAAASTGQTPPAHVEREITLSSVRRDVEFLRRKEPELDITFDVRLKGEA